MKRKGEKERAQSSATITQTLCLISGFSLILMVASYAVTTPGWWSGVLNGNPPNDYMVANQGQMKQFTARAVNELNIGLTNNGGAGSTLINLVYGWEQDYLTNGYATNTANPARPYKSSDYQAINVGQLKYIAGLVYGQLASAGYISMAPSWLHANPTSDYSAANLGQLKQAFNFDLSLPAVSSFTTTATMSGTVTLNWALASTTGVSSWLVEQESPTGGWSILTNITDPSVTSYSLSGLTNGQSAIYEVIAKGGNNVSASPSTPIYTQVPYQTNGIVDPGAPGTTNNEPVTPPVLYASGGGGQDSSNGSNGSGGITSAVNLANGAFVWSATDLKLPGVTPLAFTRTYVSSINYNGPLGVDWDFNYNRSLSVQSGAVYYHTGQGYAVQLNYVGGGYSQAQSVGSVHLSMTKFNSWAQLGSIVPLGSYSFTTGINPISGYVIADPHGNDDIFDTTGRLLFSVDRNGNILYYLRDTGGRLTKVLDAVHGTYLKLTLDANGRITELDDSAGRAVKYTYDSNYNLQTITYPATADFSTGPVVENYYDYDNRLYFIYDYSSASIIVDNGYSGVPGSPTEYFLSFQEMNDAYSFFTYGTNTMTQTAGAWDLVTVYTNDGNGNVIKKVVHTDGLHSGEPAQYETDYAYDSNNQMTQETDPSGNSTAWTYDGNGNILTVTKSMPPGTTIDTTKGTQALSATTTYTYEPRFNQVASVTDANGNETTYNYGTATSNPGGNLLTVTYPTTAAGTATEHYTYNSMGQMLTDTSPVAVTQYTYGSSTGYLNQVVRDYGTGKLNATTQYTYDSYGNVATVNDPDGNTTTYTNNALDEVAEIDGPSGEVEKFNYDARGHPATIQKLVSGALWQKSTYSYYGAEYNYGLLQSVQNYTDSTDYLTTVTLSHDTYGHVCTINGLMGRVTNIYYDERGLPYEKVDANGRTTLYDYDADGNLARLTDELGHVTTYAYDGLDRLEQKTYADGSYETWKYDAGGRVISERTAAGNTLSASYDNRNELTTLNYGSTITNSYDLLGRLLTAVEGGTSLSYTYDNLNRVSTFTDQAGRESTYAYDLAGNRLSAAYPTGITVKGVYDGSERLWKLQDGSSTTQATVSYDDADRPTGISLANGTSVTPSFDLINRLTSINNALGSSVNRNYGYTYDVASRVAAISEPRGSINPINCDDRDSVTSLYEPSGSPFANQSFNYDYAFNRSSWTQGSTTTSYTVNNLNQYTAVGSATPSWNGDGGLGSFAGNTYSYDALQRLTEVDYSGGKTLYSYDPFGRRVKKVDENTSGTVLATYQYHYDGTQVAVEYRPSVTWTYSGGVMRTDGTNKQWYYYDGQGSVSAVTDNSGNVLEKYEYNVQGQVQIANGSGTVLSATGIGNDILYTSQRYDAETGNYYDNARYYNPQLGRFISRDPLGDAELSQGTNLYAYCGNDYANEIDPSGTSGKYITEAVPSEMASAWLVMDQVWVADKPSAAVSTTGPNGTRLTTQQIVNNALISNGGNLKSALEAIILARSGNEQDPALRDADHFLVTAVIVQSNPHILTVPAAILATDAYEGLKLGLWLTGTLPSTWSPPSFSATQAAYEGVGFGLGYPYPN